jgi:methyl-accepting chemotaxis protein
MRRRTVMAIFYYMAGVIAIILVVAFLYWWIVKRRITLVLREMKEAIDSIAKGDLSRKIDIKGDKELKELAKSLNSFLENFKTLVMESQQTAEQTVVGSKKLMIAIDNVTTAAKEISTALEEIAKGAEEQAVAAQKTAKMPVRLLS